MYQKDNAVKDFGIAFEGVAQFVQVYRKKLPSIM